jgi:hypothetical protein
MTGINAGRASSTRRINATSSAVGRGSGCTSVATSILIVSARNGVPGFFTFACHAPSAKREL